MPAFGDVAFSGSPRFGIVRRLGAGGMGVVYEVRDRETTARLALKTLRSVSAETLLRLKTEFRAVQRIRHRNLVDLGELVEENGVWFYTMELVDGVSFLEYVRHIGPSPGEEAASPAVTGDTTRSPWSQKEAAPPSRVRRFDEARLRSCLVQLSRALGALHEAGLVHRDIKPSNVLVTPAGRLVLLDFGLVTSTDADLQSGASQLVGTVEYMAPEQAAQRPVGPEADWYSVGVMLYQALTGRLPFRGRGALVLIEKQHEDPPPPSLVASGVPEDLDQLCQELLQRDPAARLAKRDILLRLGVADAPHMAAGSSPLTETAPFLGREAELNALGEAYARVADGRAASVVVHGESGIGKTTLVRRFLDRVLDGGDAVVLTGRCYERESVPYKALDGVIDALSRHLRRLSALEAAALLPRHAALLGQAFPVLRRVKVLAELAGDAARQPLDPLVLRTRVFAAVRELFVRLGDHHPVVVAIDDLQWADADSLALIGEILRPPDAPRVLLVTTVRTSSEAVEAPALGLPGDTSTLHVGRLSPGIAAALARLLLRRGDGDPSLAAEIAAEARGHPEFIDELVRQAPLHDGASPRPRPRLDEALLERVAALAPAARRILEATAVAGLPLAQEVVALAAGVTPAEMPGLVARLHAGKLARASGARAADTIEPYHDRVREAIVEHLGVEACRALHRELALALEATDRTDPELLAFHWTEAGVPTRAAEYAEKAAAKADASLAFDHAARLYRTALDLGVADPAAEARLRRRLADCLVNAGRGGEAGAHYLSLARAAEPAEAIGLQRCAAEQYLRSGRIDEGMATIRTVLASGSIHLPASGKSALPGLLLRRAQLRLRGLRFHERRVGQLAPEDLARIDVCWAIGSSLGMVDPILGAAFHTRALLFALKAGEPERLARCSAIEAMFVANEQGGRSSRVARLLDMARTLAARTGSPDAKAWASAATGFAAYMGGEWRYAREHVEEAQRMLRDECVGAAWVIDNTTIWRTWALYYLGDLVELDRQVIAGLADARDRGDLFADVALRTGPPSVVWLVRDDPDGALAEARSAVRRWSQRGFHTQHWWGLAAEVQALLYAGAGAEARERLQESWSPLHRSLLPRSQLVGIETQSLLGRSALCAAAARADAPSSLLRIARRAARRIERTGKPWAIPLALLLRAGIAARRGRRSSAVRLCEEAASRFEGAEMALHAHVARRQWGRMVGGETGHAAIAAADRWMSERGVRRPERLADALAPGLRDG